MPYTTTVCRIFIASPSDVAVERDAVSQVISIWNHSHSTDVGVTLLPVRWEIHATPELGDRPQAIINRQLADQCDALVGVFWSRLGTPTGVAESGTVEEIERFRARGKHVLLYFSSAPIEQSRLDPAEYARLQLYKATLRTQGLLDTYSSVFELREKLLRHLTEVARRFTVNPALQPELASNRGTGLDVRRIIDPSDQDLPAAYEVYLTGIENEKERDPFADIQRWLSEAEEERRSPNPRLEDYLLIGRTGTRVCAFFYGHYYFKHRLFLIGYVVIDRKSREARRATSMAILNKLVEIVRRHHDECLGIAFELEMESGRDPRSRTSKEELFAVHARTAAGIVLKRLDFPYRQPRLSLWDPAYSQEERQHLVYGRWRSPALGHLVDKAEVVHVLDTIYNHWYGDYFEDDPEKDAEYRAYLRDLYDETCSELPERIRAL